MTTPHPTEDRQRLQQLAFYASPPHPCSYLPDREAVSLFADPNASMDMAIYSQLADYGFRRSGRHVYRPACAGCHACIPARIPVAEYRWRRWERRILQRNRDLQAHIIAPEHRDEHFDLYRKYIQTRHAGGGMDDPDPSRYLDFLTADWCETDFVEFRDGCGNLLALAVCDRLARGLSAVYTWFDPDHAERSLGSFAILWQIQEVLRRGSDYLYLGYWIEDCAKMRYKGRYRPLEILRDGHWRRLGETG